MRHLLHSTVRDAERALTGFWTRPSKEEGGPRQKHYWHFGVQAHARLSPEPVYRISTHVVFSETERAPGPARNGCTSPGEGNARIGTTIHGATACLLQWRSSQRRGKIDCDPREFG